MSKIHICIIFIVLISSLFYGCTTQTVQDTGRSDDAKPVYTADWESLKQRNPAPDWFRDAKFGIYFHWGVYSVPAFGSEWYPRKMHNKSGDNRRPGPSREYTHHVEKYGEPTEFGYHDFVPMFKAEKFNADEWAELFKKAGAQYAGPVAEHHDGFPMYDCSFSKFNAVEMGPERDIVGELLQSCRMLGLKAGVSSHRAFNWEFYRPKEGWENSNPAYQDLYWKPRTTRWPDEEFVNDWYLRTLELAVKYKPDIFWFDFFLDQSPLIDAPKPLHKDGLGRELELSQLCLAR